MNLAILQLVAQELNESLPGAFVNKIHQPLPREIVLRMRARGGGEKKLVLSADPQLGRIHLTSMKIPNPPRPPKFCAFLRAHFQGAIIDAISAAEDDRVVTICGSRGPSGDRSERRLILELLGRDSNIVLVDGLTGKIMNCLHHIPEKESGSRIVLPGMTYEPPPKRGRSAESLKPIPAQGELSPGITAGPNGKRKLTLCATPTDECFDSMNAAADELFTTKLGSILLDEFRREIGAPIKARIGSLERRLTKIEADQKRLRAFVERLHEGELLKANLKNARRGMTGMDVMDWDTGQNRTITLDPALSPIQNMERIFKKSSKGKRGEKAVRERLTVTLDEKRALEDLLFFVYEAADIAELEGIANELQSRKPAESRPFNSRHPVGREESNLFRSLHTPSGGTVLVGKSGKGNEFLIRKKARKGDLWFHVKGVAGAHVLLKEKKGEPPCNDDMEFAAGVAVHFSKGRDKGKVEVMIADVGDLGHPKGGIPGQVTVRSYRTILSEGISVDIA
ncbi:MAG: NFACT family protein [Desulfomonile tiedjei]|uniref:NFACT family protein n=1 Tax=Desulfomonile tiedjei TaxID=2358 RepID=A0A9D6V4T0_9BACT|nr:NFACT family protein [Desulfomonile tiedjei]